MRRLACLLWIGALAAAAGCGDPPLEAGAKAADASGAGQDGAANALGDGEQADAGQAGAVDAGGAGDTSTTPDTGGAQPDVGGVVDAGTTAEDTGATPDTNIAAPDTNAASSDTGASIDAGSADIGSPDAGGSADTNSAPTDTATADLCPNCPWDKQPTGDHPGAKGSSSSLSPKVLSYKTGFGNGDKQMRVWVPLAAGAKPVLFFVHGFNLHTTGGFSSELGHAYKALLEHVASRGYVVAFVRVQGGITSCDHKQMAQLLVEATAELFKQVSKADPTRVAYAGHSMGAKVALLAARRTINQDPKNEWPDPQAVLLFNLDNSKPPVCLAKFEDAKQAASELLKDEKVRITFVHTDDDKVSPYKDKTKGALAVYEALKLTWRQFIVLHGTGKDDPNPPTNPELADDHAASLTVNGNVGGIADIGLPPSKLDALDWYGYWKILVGALDFHFQKGDAKWAYGALRTHGGKVGGKVITHQVLQQGW